MRLVPALALAALLASPALAQTQYADSSGGFLALNRLSLDSGSRAIDGTIGYRLGNGLDLGVRLGYATGFNYDSAQIDVISGITRPLGAGFTGRIEGAVGFATSSGLRQPYTDADAVFHGAFDYRFRTIREDVSATVGRRIPLFGSVALRPSAGVYAAARQFVTTDYPDETFQVNRSAVTSGVQVEIPLTFRLFGTDAAIMASHRRGLTGDRYFGTDMPSGGGFRLNF